MQFFERGGRGICWVCRSVNLLLFSVTPRWRATYLPCEVCRPMIYGTMLGVHVEPAQHQAAVMRYMY